MCTLILGYQVLGAGTLILAANRDENPARPSDPPGLLGESPRVVGGRDRLAGGTWLAIRERSAVVAMLNRRETPGEGATTTRGATLSRGLLTLEVAGFQLLPQLSGVTVYLLMAVILLWRPEGLYGDRLLRRGG